VSGRTLVATLLGLLLALSPVHAGAVEAKPKPKRCAKGDAGKRGERCPKAKPKPQVKRCAKGDAGKGGKRCPKTKPKPQTKPKPKPQAKPKAPARTAPRPTGPGVVPGATAPSGPSAPADAGATQPVAVPGETPAQPGIAQTLGVTARDRGNGDFTYDLSRPALAAGTLTVFFRNGDLDEHDLLLVNPSGGAHQLSARLGPEEESLASATITPGTWSFVCSLHPGMTRSVVVG
jgi:plastocyanin